jgi:uncharacterized membrane protein YhaH (DUF805 family)
MLPMAFVYLYYWSLANQLLSAAGYRQKTVLLLGFFSFAALLSYTLALGLAGDTFQQVRRIGITLYFGLTYLNQLFVLDEIHKRRLPDRTRHLQLALCIVILSIGLLTVFLDIFLDNYADYEDAFEWVLALLLHVNFFIAGIGWRSLSRQPAGQ